MRNSIAAGRRLAARIVIAQAGVSLLMALVFLAQGWRPATGAFAGGALVLIGTTLLAARMFADPAQGAGLAFFRFIAGTALKWLVTIGGLYALIGVWELPPLPVLAGFTATLLVNLLGLRFKE
ncbi:MAG TPA: ATP synthase subunit I [Tahibacter sp.]|nr:ATP synthase subunit I [Tahibacter sp.]